MKIKGSSVLVTGPSRGPGRGSAEELASLLIAARFYLAARVGRRARCHRRREEEAPIVAPRPLPTPLGS